MVMYERRNVVVAVLILTLSVGGCRNSQPAAGVQAGGTATTQQQEEGSVGAATALDDAGNTVSPYHATVGGGTFNHADASHTTVSGGSHNTAAVEYAAVGGGSRNVASATRATIGGGFGNLASHIDATVGGGGGNTASGRHATVGGGSQNVASGFDATVAGGSYNAAEETYAAVGGGTRNTASAYGSWVGGGAGNASSALQAAVGGGLNNSSEGSYGVVGGGYGNVARGDHSTVPGGALNEAAADYSFAAGWEAQVAAEHTGAFVYADASAVPFRSLAAGEFAVRATGGVRMVTAVDNEGRPTAGTALSAGSGSWSALVDEALLSDVEAADAQQILNLLAGLPVYAWRYQGQDSSVRHIGPLGQDFNEAFGLGEDARYISGVDADGVSLAALQALYQIVQEQQVEIDALKARLEELEAAK
jgi:hypothetical protein